MASSKLQIPGGLLIPNPYPADAKYFNPNTDAPYADLATAKSVLVAGYRHKGLVINVNGVEYWWGPNSDLSDGDLKPFPQALSIFTTLSDLRNAAVLGPQQNVPYYITDAGCQGYFFYDSTDTTTVDDTGSCIVNTTNNYRFKRLIVGGVVETSWWQLVPDGDTTLTDNLPMFTKCANFATTNGYKIHFSIPGAVYYFSNKYLTTKSIHIDLNGSTIRNEFGFVHTNYPTTLISSTENKLRDLNGNLVPDFSELAIRNRLTGYSDAVVPAWMYTTILDSNPFVIECYFSEPLNTGAALQASDFILDTGRTILSFAISTFKVSITVDVPYDQGEGEFLTYTSSPGHEIKDVTGNNAPNIVDRRIVNQVGVLDNFAPVVLGANVYQANTSLIEINISEPLDPAFIPPVVNFPLGLTSLKSVTNVALSVDGYKVLLTVDIPFTLSQTNEIINYTTITNYFTTVKGIDNFPVIADVTDGIQVGDIVLLRSNMLRFAKGRYKHGNYCKVTKIQDNKVYITRPFYDSYTVDNLLIVHPFDFTVENGIVDMSTAYASVKALVADNCSNVKCLNVRFYGSKFAYAGLDARGDEILVRDSFASGFLSLSNGRLGYGFTCSGNRIMFNNVWGENNKHTFSLDNRDFMSGTLVMDGVECYSPSEDFYKMAEANYVIPTYNTTDIFGNPRVVTNFITSRQPLYQAQLDAHGNLDKWFATNIVLEGCNSLMAIRNGYFVGKNIDIRHNACNPYFANDLAISIYEDPVRLVHIEGIKYYASDFKNPVITPATGATGTCTLVKGSRTITFSGVPPTGWKQGDFIFIPTNHVASINDPVYIISSVGANTILLDRGYTEPSGVVSQANILAGYFATYIPASQRPYLTGLQGGFVGTYKKIVLEDVEMDGGAVFQMKGSVAAEEANLFEMEVIELKNIRGKGWGGAHIYGQASTKWLKSLKDFTLTFNDFLLDYRTGHVGGGCLLTPIVTDTGGGVYDVTNFTINDGGLYWTPPIITVSNGSGRTFKALLGIGALPQPVVGVSIGGTLKSSYGAAPSATATLQGFGVVELVNIRDMEQVKLSGRVDARAFENKEQPPFWIKNFYKDDVAGDAFRPPYIRCDMEAHTPRGFMVIDPANPAVITDEFKLKGGNFNNARIFYNYDNYTGFTPGIAITNYAQPVDEFTFRGAQILNKFPATASSSPQCIRTSSLFGKNNLDGLICNTQIHPTDQISTYTLARLALGNPFVGLVNTYDGYMVINTKRLRSDGRFYANAAMLNNPTLAVSLPKSTVIADYVNQMLYNEAYDPTLQLPKFWVSRLGTGTSSWRADGQDYDLITGTDADITATFRNAMVNLPVITANRVLNLPTPVSGLVGAKYKIRNNNTSYSFKWTTDQSIYRPNGRTQPYIPNLCEMTLECDGTVWRITSLYVEKIAEKQYKWEFDDDFPNTSSNDIWTTSTSGTGATANGTGQSPGSYRVGIRSLETGTTNAGRASISHNNISLVAGGGEVAFDADVYLPTLSDSVDQYVIRLGYGDNNSGDHTDGIYFEYDPQSVAQVLCKTASNSVRTSNNSGVSPAAATWNNFKIICPSTTQALFYINETLVSTITTNIPIALGRETAVFLGIIKVGGSVGTNNSRMYVDYVAASKYFNQPRT